MEEKFKIRCAKCKNFLKTEAEVAANQYDSKGAGERLCRACARDKKGGRNEKADAENHKRKAAAEARPLTCAACGEAFSYVKHLNENQVEHHRKALQKRVVCGDCTRLGFTARNWQAFQCFGACNRKLPKSKFEGGPHFARAHKNGTLKCKACA